MSVQLPKKWALASIGQINERVRGISINPADSPDTEYELYSVPAFPLRVPERVLGRDIGSTKQVVEPGDVLLCKINPRINRVWVVGEAQGLPQIASSEWIVVRSRAAHPSFLRYVLSENSFRKELCKDLTGVGGSLTRAQPKRVATLRIPLAPLNEQKRIADKLDQLLEDVDACKARLDRVPAILKRFRQSVLAAATSGELTDDGLVGEGDTNGWKRGSFMEFFDIQGGTQPPKSEFVYEAMEGYIRLLQIRDFGDKPVPTYVPRRKGLKICVERDVLLGRYGASVGRVCTGMAGAYNVALAKVKPRTEVEPAFLAYLLMAEPFQAGLRQISRSAQNGFNKEDLARIEVALPPLPQQQEIVRRVDALFAAADALGAKLTAAQARVDKLTQSLLAKAFRGELVPQDPNDEPADALLERIRAEQWSDSPTRRGRRKKVTTV